MKKIIGTILILVLFHQMTFAQHIGKEWLKEHYTKTEVRIPMRDSISLYTSIYTPKQMNGKRPVIMHRTPYGCRPYGEEFRMLKEFRNYYLHDYIIVMQDVRGRFMSEGEFINMEERPEDTWDTVEWLLENVPGNNGRVGLTGYSYPGYFALMGALSRHPAIKAVAPQAPISDWYKGDDIHHNGVLMLLDSYCFGRNFFRDCPNPTPSMPPVEDRIDKPVYDFFLEKRTFRNITATFPEPLAFWESLATHPDYDEYWEAKSAADDLTDIKAAVLVVGGSYDTDDCYGALHTYRSLKTLSPAAPLHLVYGPWYHGGWRSEATYLDNIEFPFFEHYLCDKPYELPAVTVIPSRHSRGNQPEAVLRHQQQLQLGMKELPDTEKNAYTCYLSGKSQLSTRPPRKGHSKASRYTSDPAAPVPHFDQPVRQKDKRYMIADQRFASKRKDVLSFAGSPLSDTLRLVGPAEVDLYVRSSTPDADFVVKVIDAAPDGHEMLVRWEVMRARYREGFSRPVPMVPDQATRIRFRLPDIAHYFLPGHRLMIQIQSSFFPAIDLNPGIFLENIYEAEPDDFVPAEISILHSPEHPSRVVFNFIGTKD